jgi:aryl-alcohol dehydrogenase
MKPTAGKSFAMFGMGALGFAAIHMARKAGCSPIIAIDLHEGRLELAKEFGATHVINASKDSDTVAQVRTICPDGVNFSFEAAGSAKVMDQAFQALAKRGTCILSGVVQDQAARLDIRPSQMMSGRTVGGALLGDGDPTGVVRELMEDIRNGSFPLSKLVRFYDFANINEAMDDAERGEVVKPILRM